MVDALASGASVRMDVEVRVLFWAPNYPLYLQEIFDNKFFWRDVGPLSGPLLGPLRRIAHQKCHR